MPETLNIQDGLISTVAELGTMRDKGASVSYVEAEYQDQELVAAYRTSWLARKIVDIPAQDMFRAWRSWQAEEDQIEKIEKLEKHLGIQIKLLKAKRFARLYGECHLYFDLGDDPASPVNPERVRKGGLRFVTLLTHRQIQPGDVDQDPLSPTFGKPLWYAVVGARQGDVRIHPSRLISFTGAQRPDAEEFGTMPGHRQGDSVLYALMSAIKQFDGVAANINSLVYEAKIDVISVKGLTTHIAGNPHEEAKLLARYRMAATAKGNNGMLLLDGDNETYEQKSFQFSALADIMDRYAQNSAGGADIPMTRLFGRSPGGMNATGDSDLRNYYDRISSDQELEARPALEIFDECLIRAALGARPPETYYKWSSLWQVSDKERAELGRIGVQTVKTLKDTGLIPDEVLSRGAVNLLTQDGVIPGLEAEYDQYFEAGGEDPWDQNEGGEEPPDPPEGTRVQDEQPRAPKGSPNGGQWVKAGGGGGGASAAAAKVATAKYSAEKVQALTEKDPKSLSHYEKKVLVKYKKALQEEQSASSEKSSKPKTEKPQTFNEAVAKNGLAAATGKAESDAQAAKAKALAAVATKQYPAEKVQALLDKNPKDLSQYEKKKLHAYKKALQTEQAAGLTGNLQPKAAGGTKPKLGTPETNAALDAIKAGAHAPYGMQLDTVQKLATGEWQPDPNKPYQAKIAAAGKEYLETGKLPQGTTVVTKASTGASPASLAANLNSPPPISDFSKPQTSFARATGLTSVETSAAKKYTGSTYHDINGALRKGSTHSLVPQLDAALAKSAAVTDMTVVRGVSANGMQSWLAATGGELKVGAVIRDKGYVSTTRSAKVASNFAGGGTGYGLKINIPKGSKILPLKSISNYAQEDEFLLPRGSGFRITGYDPKTRVVQVDLVAA